MAGEVERLQELVDKYDNIVFFGGAGVSTESGIRISEVRTDFIIKNMTILQKQS